MGDCVSRVCILWLASRCTLGKEKNNAPLMPPIFHNQFPHLPFPKHMDIRPPSLRQRLCAIRYRNLLPRTLDRSRWAQMARPSRPIRLLFLHSRLPFPPLNRLPNPSLLEKHIQNLVHSPPSLFHTNNPFCFGVPSLAPYQGKKQRSA